jgi:hypothetical protein
MSVAFNQLQTAPWFKHLGEPLTDATCLGNSDEQSALYQEDPDRFFESVYDDAYERLCTIDYDAAHNYAQSLDKKQLALIDKLAEQVYLAAFKNFAGQTEICGLLSDDVRAIGLLLLQGQPLSQFTQQRLKWYLSGRAPWGYIDGFPNGQWIIL